MRRFWLAVPLLSALAGCTIEETPQEYIDHLTTPAAELDASRDELTARLMSIAPSVQRNDRTSLTGALSPLADVLVLRGERADALTEPRALIDTLISISGDAEVEVRESVVTIGPNNDVAWFRAVYGLVGEDGPAELSFSGVFVREGGSWRLAQGHLTSPVSPPLPPAPEPGDTLPEGG